VFERVLDRQAQIVAAPILGRRPQHQLAQAAPASRQVSERAQDAEHRIGLRRSLAVDVQIRKAPNWQIRGGPQLEGARHHLLVRPAVGRVRLGRNRAQVCLRVGSRELARQLLAHAIGACAHQESTSGLVGVDLDRKWLGQRDGCKQVLGGPQRSRIRARRHHLDQRRLHRRG